MTNLFKGELLPPLFLNEKTEEDIYNLSPRTFILGIKEYESLALSNYQYRIFLNNIVGFLSNQTEKEILDYTKEENKSLLFNEVLSDYEQIFPIRVEILILSCCDYNVKNLLLKLIQIQEEINTFNMKLKVLPNGLNFRNIFNLFLYIKLLLKLKMLIRNENDLRDKIDNIVNNVLMTTSVLQWNIAFNYIIEQNDILNTAMKYVKKKTRLTELTINQ